MINRFQYEWVSPGPSSVMRRRGFTLVEVMASAAILAIMLTGIITIYSRTLDQVADQTITHRAAAVAQRQLELLLASNREPDISELEGRDEFDPDFIWTMELSRVPIGVAQPSSVAEDTVIEAVVSVVRESDFQWSEPLVTMARYYSSDMEPLEGNQYAVMNSQVDDEPPWLMDLRDRLGREPTLDEILQEMMSVGVLNQDEQQLLQGVGVTTPMNTTPQRNGL